MPKKGVFQLDRSSDRGFASFEALSPVSWGQEQCRKVCGSCTPALGLKLGDVALELVVIA